MRSLDFSRYAFSICVTTILLAGCGGSQPPIGAPVAPPQIPAIAAARTAAHRTTSGWSYSVVYKFRSARGGRPQGELLDLGGTLYGTTVAGGAYNKGTVYGISRRGADTVIHSFGGASNDGAQPRAGLVELNGALYGTTVAGGANGKGTVFSVAASGTEKVLYSFAGGSDGANPVGPLVAVDGTLYGATLYGGATCSYSNGCGTVYSVSTSGDEKVLHAFSGQPDGAFPSAGLLSVNGTLYGTTASGGSKCHNFYSPCGVVYTVSTSGSEKVLYSFKGGADGSVPSATLIDVSSKLYGTTEFGGGTGCDFASQHLGCGVVYSLTTTGIEKILHRFCVGTEHDAANPAAPLVELNGALYGTASGNGTCTDGQRGPGTIYSVTTAGAVNVLYVFSQEGGHGPSSGLIDVNGALYGVAVYGGRSCLHDYNYSGCGVAYALSQ